jgi:hypothetical protein
MFHKAGKRQTGFLTGRFISAGFLTFLMVQAVGLGQASSSLEEGVVTMTLLGDTDTNKALGWLWPMRVGNHLKRQAGVADASYKPGDTTIEIQASSQEGFEIGSLLETLHNDMGFSPIKRIDATIPGRIEQAGNGYVLHVSGSDERLTLKGSGTIAEGVQVLKGVLETGSDGTLMFKPDSWK